MKQGTSVRAEFDRIMPDGSGAAVIDGDLLTVKGAVPGDTADVLVRRKKRDRARGTVETMLVEGMPRIVPPCPHFSICGGCLWQNIPYDDQCWLKTRMVADILSPLTGEGLFRDFRVMPSPDEYYYRNKMEFTFDSPPREDAFYLGLHEAGRYNSVFTVTDCRLQSRTSNDILAFVRQFVEEHGLSIWGLKSHRGLLRFCVIREGKATGDIMVNLVTSGEPFPLRETFSRELAERFPTVRSCIHTVNTTPASVATGEERHVLYGSETISDAIGPHIFQISPDSFFQTNTRQTKQLYARVADMCRLTGGGRVLDLYCGTGTIGIYVAEKAREVVGIETVPEAVDDAVVNARHNGVENMRFIRGDVEDMPGGADGAFDVTVCDPPRAGLHPKAMKTLLALQSPRIVYVSCNLKALRNDLEVLREAGYRPVDVAAFDMAPHTPHVETVLALVNK